MEIYNIMTVLYTMPSVKEKIDTSEKDLKTQLDEFKREMNQQLAALKDAVKKVSKEIGDED